MFEIKKVVDIGNCNFKEIVIAYAKTKDQAIALVNELRELSQTQMYYYCETYDPLTVIGTIVKEHEKCLLEDKPENYAFNLGIHCGTIKYIKEILEEKNNG